MALAAKLSILALAITALHACSVHQDTDPLRIALESRGVPNVIVRFDHGTSQLLVDGTDKSGEVGLKVSLMVPEDAKGGLYVTLQKPNPAAGLPGDFSIQPTGVGYKCLNNCPGGRDSWFVAR